MGVEIGAVRFLSLFSQAGTDFSQTLTLGRQSLHVNPIDFNRALLECGIDKSDLIQPDGFSERFFAALGAKQVVALDASEYEHATIQHDLNQPITEDLKQQYSVVFDGGTLEHVFNYPVALKNAMEMVRVGGHFVGISVCNNFAGHGFYQFSPELYFRVFAESNGYKMLGVYVFEVRRSGADTGTAFEVIDPDRVKHRILLRNTEETLIVVWAQRTHECAIFEGPILQSDYVQAWHAGQGNNTLRTPTSRVSSVTRSIRYSLRLATAPVAKLARALRFARTAFTGDGYRRIRLDIELLEDLRSRG